MGILKHTHLYDFVIYFLEINKNNAIHIFQNTFLHKIYKLSHLDGIINAIYEYFAVLPNC